MTNNDILRRLRYTFNLDDTQMMERFALAGEVVSRADLSDWLKKEEHEDFLPMRDQELAFFLNGLIIDKRGKRDDGLPIAEVRLTNNLVLAKLKIALSLKDDDMLEIFLLAGRKISKHELSAFFRNPTKPQYMPCNDQLLRNFLRGLQLKFRPHANGANAMIEADELN